MKLQVLGCSGAEQPGHHLTSFLLDNTLLLDAGTVSAVLGEGEQRAVREILVTHTHLDHICGIPLLADNLIGSGGQVVVTSTREILASISAHLLNGMIWPDFTRIPSAEAAVLRYREIEPGIPFESGPFSIVACPVNHSVPAVAYRVSRGGATLLYTGDTGPTEAVWKLAGELSALIVEVSFPSDQEELALLTGHLTPRLLAGELAKLDRLPPRILITHLKPSHHDQIKAELDALGIPGLQLLKDGDQLTIDD
ncbi:cAMP phosphodiesterase class-II:metallo-beta-lactamase superfamily protein [Geomonas limicola]|uniref:cAMP phosphodiesterase class-II:metallo-beta-lactamase superfamily protein n=1 Tax=Geomonas limicola TaxID=2740186 RepID=A0A6V8N8A2_9BACT|nr:3',5'-cyclic-nucleotide phosphodiesterase [Geomonas limicola]GFO67997.1 cAMP phosphodiesterase class-II:metallo-beta-lactamase superfamily protein [Geomonas limicola]